MSPCAQVLIFKIVVGFWVVSEISVVYIHYICCFNMQSMVHAYIMPCEKYSKFIQEIQIIVEICREALIEQALNNC